MPWKTYRGIKTAHRISGTGEAEPDLLVGHVAFVPFGFGNDCFVPGTVRL